MKSSVITFIGVVLMVVTLHAFRAMQQPNITGKIIPWNGATQVWAINGNRLVRVIPAGGGEFKFAVQPGNWKIFVDANTPYQDLRVPAVVKDGQQLDLGKIILQ